MEYVDFNAKGSATTANDESTTMQIKANKIRCCECGVKIQSNGRNMCQQCLREHIDIAENICKLIELQYCKNCERYLQPPVEWINARWESRELLGLCLKKLKGLKNLQLIDACFIWTEPHAKRIKVKLVMEAKDTDVAGIRQSVLVEYTIQNQMCKECHRVEAKDYWRCVVQVRQHAQNKKTYLYLEQLILKHGAHEHTLGIKPMHGGLDFYYANENHARKFVSFVESKVPVKVTSSRRLISHDKTSNIHYYKYTWSVEIAPLSKDSLVCLTAKSRQQLGNLPSLCLVYRVSHGMHLVDPMTGKVSELSGLTYFRAPFEPICNPKQLVEFVVMDIEPSGDYGGGRKTQQNGKVPQNLQICDIWLVRSSQLGTNDTTIHSRTHLGHLLNVGDTVMGYAMTETNINQAEYEKLSSEQIPDIILVRKCYDRQLRNKQRQWKLKHLSYGGPVDDRLVKDKMDFIEDLEEDADFRKNINIYSDQSKSAEASEENEVVDEPLETAASGDEKSEGDIICLTETLSDLSTDSGKS